MARILHVADLHYGALTHSRPDPETGYPSALVSVDRCFGEAVNVALRQSVDAVVIAGDVFETRHPDALALNLFAARLRELTDNEIPVVIVAGNHDGATRPNQPSVLEIFHDEPLVQVSTHPEVVFLEDLAVATLPWVSRAHLQALRPELTREQAEQRQMDALVAVLGMLRNTAPDGSILALHWSIQGAVLSSERDISMIPEQVIPLSELEGPWSYVAAGHIHRSQAIAHYSAGGTGSVGQYAGSIDRRNFGEESEKKFALEVLVSNGAVQNFHELPSREFVTLEPDRGDRYIGPGGEPVENAIIRVRLALDEEQANEVDQGAIQRELLGAGAHIATVEVQVDREDRRRDREVTEQIGEAEALDRFLDARQVEEERRPAIRDRAKQLGEGV